HYGANGYTGMLSADIQVSNRTPGGRLMGRTQVQKTVAHELGHVLGLEDSARIEDTMGPVPLWNSAVRVDPAAVRALLELDARAKSIIDTLSSQGTSCDVPRAFHFMEPR